MDQLVSTRFFNKSLPKKQGLTPVFSIGGIISSTVLTLFVLPVLYSLVTRERG